MGVANNHSIAWGISKACGAGRRTRLHLSGRCARQARQAAGGRSSAISSCPATSRTSPRSTRRSTRSRKRWGKLDFVVHAIGFSDKNELKGLYADTTRDEFQPHHGDLLLLLHRDRQARAPLMTDGGSMLTLTYGGSTRVMPNYNVMGVAKAALEASVRYLAADYGPRASASTRSRPARSDAGRRRHFGDFAPQLAFAGRSNSPLRRTVTIEEVGELRRCYLLSDLSQGGVTGEIHYRRLRLQHHLDAGPSFPLPTRKTTSRPTPTRHCGSGPKTKPCPRRHPMRRSARFPRFASISLQGLF
jgi:enoyl-[acyl-carrier protein] reductase I